MPSVADSQPICPGDGQPHLISRLTSHDSVEQTVEEYDRAASMYDETFADEAFPAPRMAAEAVLNVFPADGPVPRDQLKVMDVAAGTGVVGMKLYNAGITNLDALEPSKEMVKVTQGRGIYQRIINDVIGHHRIDVEDNTYDAVVVSASFAPGHCPITALDEMIRICRPGGYIINAMRMEFLFIVDEYDQMLPQMRSLEERGVWRRVTQSVFDRYFKDSKQGITFVYQKR